MLIRRTLLLTLFSLTPFLLIAGSQHTHIGTGEFRQFVHDEINKQHIVGAAAALIVDGKVVLRFAAGYADKNRRIPMTTQTQVGIGSATKTITSLAVMQLREQYKVDIDAPLSDYLPQFQIKTHGEDLRQVTLRTLLNHTSGVPSDVFVNSDLAHARYTDVVDLLNKTAMAHPPHLVGLYSNVGYSLVAHALTKASGVDYATYVKRSIFTPLRMKNSGFGTDRSNRTLSYYPDGTEASPPELRDIASGGIYSTVDDLLRYAQALIDAYHGRQVAGVSTRSVRLMWTLSNGDVPIETNKKGLGWFLFQNDSVSAAYHSGSTFFANASILIIPEHRAAAILLNNTAGGHALAERFAFRLLEHYGISVSDIIPRPIPMLRDSLVVNGPLSRSPAPDTGFYAQKNGFAKVSVEGTGLCITLDGRSIHVEADGSGGFSSVPQAGDIGTEQYFFEAVGRYHVMFSRRGDRDQQLGYRTVPRSLDSVWARRLGRYELFGYKLTGFEQLHSAEIATNEEGVPILRMIYNTGTYTYSLVDLERHEARTGGLGPEHTGIMIYFAGEPGSEELTYLGLTLRQAPR